MSFPDREEGQKIGTGFGKGVSRLRFAHENIAKAMTFKTLRPSYFDFGKQILAMITKEKETAEAENLSIYMDGIPAIETLSIIEELTIVQPKHPPQIDIESPVTGQETLLCLVPKEVLALSAEYKDVLLQMTNAEANKINAFCREISTALESMGLPQKINAISSEVGLPDAIWKKIQQAQVSGGYFQLENSLASLRHLSENCQKNLADLNTTLVREEEEDKSLRQSYGYQWNRALSAALNASLRAELDKYNMKLGQAVQLDQSTIRTWEGNQECLQLLKNGKSELDSLVPANEAQQNPNTPADQLRAILEQITQAQQATDEVLKTLTSEAEHDNITEALLQLVEAKLPKENAFNHEISKFNPRKEEITARIAETRALLSTVAQANAEFERIKGNIQSNPRRMQILTQLEQAVKIYNDLSSVFSQGHQFYANLSTHLSIMQQKVADFIYSRNLEKNELIGQLSSRGGQPSGNAPNPYGQFYPPGPPPSGPPQGSPYGQFK